MNQIQKNEITQLVKENIERLGSMAKVANKTGVSEATISLLKNGKTEKMADKIWLRIGAALGWTSNGWQEIETINTKIIRQIFDDAKEQGMWIAISNKAGSGKTASCNLYEAEGIVGVHVVRCWEWGKKEFMKELCRQLGIALPKGNFNANDLMKGVVDYFKQRISQKPLLIIDEADKLRPGALRNLIPLYNELEGQLGVVIIGTENLRKEIKRGVNYARKGYDEIDSRFGRKYIKLIGATKKEVVNICQTNGINSKEIGMKIFNECIPVQTVVSGRTLMVVEDMRRVKRAIQRELKRAKAS